MNDLCVASFLGLSFKMHSLKHASFQKKVIYPHEKKSLFLDPMGEAQMNMKKWQRIKESN